VDEHSTEDPRQGERPRSDVDDSQFLQQRSGIDSLDESDMRGIGALSDLLRCDEDHPTAGAHRREISLDQRSPGGGIEMLEHMGQQERIEWGRIQKFELLRRVGLQTEFPAGGHRGRIVIDADPVAVEEREAPPDTAADVEDPSQSETSEVPSVGIGDDTLPERRRSGHQAFRVPGVGGVGAIHLRTSLGLARAESSPHRRAGSVAGVESDRTGDDIDVSVVIVVYGEEPWLERSITAALGSERVCTEVVLVENGGSESVIASFEGHERVTVVRPGRNTGFAEGCNLGVDASCAPFVALINPDAVVEPQALRELLEVAARPGVGIATSSLRLGSAPDRLNSAGNEVSFLGLSWAGHFGEPAEDHAVETDVISATGAAMLCRRRLWESLGGLEAAFFAYFEDTEFSLRCWQRGERVVYVPDAVVVHRYEFSRNAEKFFLLERNRLITMLTCFDARHMIAILPLALIMELGLVALATKDGWLLQKFRSYRAVFADRRTIRARRRLVMSERTARPGRLLDLFTVHLRPGNMPDAHPPAIVERLLAIYWRMARRLMNI
jgi:GT2 family glycosyltransferase